MKLSIITPSRVAKQLEIVSITAPSSEGEITILERHQPLLSLLQEGIVTYRLSDSTGEESLAIGGGYLQTDGSEVRILVSRAYGQDEIDAARTAEAVDRARELLSQAPDPAGRIEAQSMLRRSLIDQRLLKKRPRAASTPTQ